MLLDLPIHPADGALFALGLGIALVGFAALSELSVLTYLGAACLAVGIALVVYMSYLLSERHLPTATKDTET